MSVIPDFKAATIMPFLTQNVAPGSTSIRMVSKVSPVCRRSALNMSLATNPSDRSCAKARSPLYHLPIGRLATSNSG